MTQITLGEDQDQAFMREALVEAKIAYGLGEVPIGAVVVHGKKVVGRGHNMRETWRDPTAHAEVIAIRQASAQLQAWRLTDCTLYVTIEPCPMCAGALVLSRIDRLVYGATDLKAGAIESLYNIASDTRLNHQVPITAGVLEQECGDMMRRFFRNLRMKKDRHEEGILAQEGTQGLDSEC